MLIRKIGRILRGGASPSQLVLASMIGSIIGFMPGFSQAGGLIFVMLLLLIVLNASLPLAAMVGMVAKLISLLVMPISFQLGRVLLDGPTQPLFKTMINAPVLALFGFEYYATTGGLVIGVMFGAVVGFVVVNSVRRFRLKMAELEEGSERFRNVMASRWTRLVTWVLIGGGAKENYKELLTKKGKMIRPIGAVFAVLVIALLFLVHQFFAGPIVTATLKNTLEFVNGATVDLESAEVALSEGRMTANGLAMADPKALDTNLFEAERIDVNVSGFDLLRKRITLDRVALVGGRNGMLRSVPGRLLRAPPKASPSVDIRPGEKSLDDYLVQAGVWKTRLAQIRQWLDILSGPESPVAETDVQRRETLRERLEREVRDKGYTRVAATHLIEGAPFITVIELAAERVRSSELSDETLDISGGYLSTQPYLLERGPNLSIRSSGGTLLLGLDLGGVSKSQGESTVTFHYKGLPVDAVASHLPTVQNQRPISGGTMDVSLDGKMATVPTASIAMPLNITLYSTTVSVPGAGQAPVERMTLPLQLRGPIDNPRIMLSDDVLAESLKQAGAEILASRVRAETDKITDKAVGKLSQRVDEQAGERIGEEIGERAKGLFDGLRGGRKKDPDK